MVLVLWDVILYCWVSGSGFVGCDTVLLGEWFLVFQSNIVISSSGIKQTKKMQSTLLGPYDPRRCRNI